MRDTIWLDPVAIVHKISPVRGLVARKGGDWDLERRFLFRETAKFKAIRARYIEGADWLETELFADSYARRLKRDGHVGGIRSLEALALDYGRRFDRMVEALRRDGFRLTNGNGKRYALPAFLVGRDGEVFIGNQGNHRLAIAQVLGLERIAGKVQCRHQLATR